MLDMGEPVKIVDLARQMIRLSGRSLRDAAQPDGDVEIVFTGLRPGEKLYEELLISASDEPSSHPLIRKARERCLAEAEFAGQLRDLDAALAAWDDRAVQDCLSRLMAG